MDESCRKEVFRLHQFFEDWFLGRIPNDDETFAGCADVLAAAFEIIPPSGELTGRAELLERLRDAHGQYGKIDFRIRISEVRGRTITDDAHMVTYQEWQETDGTWTARWSSAVFRRNSQAPNGVEWVHVQETWMPEPEGDG